MYRDTEAYFRGMPQRQAPAVQPWTMQKPAPQPQERNRLKEMLDNPASFQESPGFKFNVNRSMDALNRNLSARGLNNSGKQLEDLTELATGLSLQDYGNQLDRLGRFDAQDKDFALGSYQAANQYDLGKESNRNAQFGTAANYDLGLRRDALDQNRFGLQEDESDLNWYNAQTQRGNALRNWLKRGEG